MASLELHVQSERAAKARVGRLLRGAPIFAVRALIYCCFVGGIVLLLSGYGAGWFVASLAAVPAMISLWYRGDLQRLAPRPQGESLDDVLEADILAQLTDRTTPLQLVEIIAGLHSGQFLAARTGITAALLQHLATEDRRQMDDIWQSAHEIRQQTGSAVLHGGIVALAILRQHPQGDTVLAHMHIDQDEVLACIQWYDHIQALLARTATPRRTGGVARDWSFGYTPLLNRFGMTLGASADFTRETANQQRIVAQLIETFGSEGRQNAALIGPGGVGKTEILRVFAAKILDASADVPANLRFRQVVLLDASSLIAAAPGRGELEGLIMKILAEAYYAKNIIICLDNAQLFFEEAVGSVDIANVLQPILEAGKLRMILTMDEQRMLQINQRNPGLMSALNRMMVAEPSKEEVLQVMQDQLMLTEAQKKVVYMYQSLVEAYRLSQRYIHDVAMPGRAVKLLEMAASYAEGGLVTINSVQQAIEQAMDVKVSVASTADDREKLLQLEDNIHQRMIGQARAVQAVSDALRRARAGVRNQDRPIGTFLFLGPTGVGKTELAKSLAEVYFGGESKIVRVDLNEYVGIDDVTRLIADGATDAHSLTAQVMKQPFSVILLDEIEKAHPNVLTALLQVLDEGILRDINNREVSFRDAIVIATSNAGADRIREYIQRGYQLEQFQDHIVNELISSNQFKPEFLNRFDEIVVFEPLKKPELLQIVDLIIDGINATLALQKVRVEVAPDAKQLLVERGYDPRLGARPMRRMAQRAVENTAAKAMLAGDVAPGGVITITRQQVEAALGGPSVLDSEAASEPTLQ